MISLNSESGSLTLQIIDTDSFKPIPEAKAKIYKTMTDLSTSSTPLYQDLKSNESGEVDNIELNAPNMELSENPSSVPAYSTYVAEVDAPGYRKIIVDGIQLLPSTEALQPLYLNKVVPASTFAQNEKPEVITVLPNTLLGGFASKIPEDPNKPDPPPSGLVVLDEPVIPQYIVVHDGSPDDPSAPNYYEPFKAYIKNVASSEIYATWPETTIRANVLCILSFTLNRVFTEWYRAKGKNFTITSSTAYDHAYSRGRNIYKNISQIVDGVFTDFIKRPDKRQPLLTQYCDGFKVTCPNWLTQWGSKFLGDKGMTPIEILKYFYGPDISLSTAKKVLGIPASYPGYNLKIGSTGNPVRQIQRQLNRISDNFPAIAKVKIDGVYGKGTADSVKSFQQIFFLPQTGVVDYSTWYKISDIYVGVTKLAELS